MRKVVLVGRAAIGLVVLGLLVCGVVACGSGDDGAALTEAPDVQPTTSAEIQTLLNDRMPKARDGFVSAEYTDITGYVQAQFNTTDDDFWDDDAAVRQMAENAVDVFSVAFIPKAVKEAPYFALFDMTDQYGNTESEKGITITMTRGEWSNVSDPEAFKERITAEPTTMYDVAESYWIHPGIYKNAKDFSETMPSYK